MKCTPALSVVSAANSNGTPDQRPPAPNFDDRADASFIRACDLVRDPKNPNRATVLDISPSTLWRYVAAGTFPQPIRLSAGVTVWKVGAVRAWIDKQHGEALALAA